MIPAQRLQTHPMLRAIDPVALSLLAAGSVERRFPRGATIFRAGDPARGLWLVLEGTIRIVRTMGDRRRVVHFEGPGGTLGEVPLFDGGGYPATAVSDTPSTVILVPGDALRGALRASPDLAWSLLSRLSARVRGLVDRLDQWAAETVRRRLAGWLLARMSDDGLVRLTGSQAALAEELGTAREVLVRELARFRAEGMVAGAGRRAVRVVDRAALDRVSQDITGVPVPPAAARSRPGKPA